MAADPEFQKDRDLFQFLLANRKSISRNVNVSVVAAVIVAT